MKKTLLILAILSFFCSFAQSYQIDNGGDISNTTLTYWVDTSATFTTYYDIKNISSAGVAGQVKKVNEQLNDPGATTWFCIGSQCYLPIATSSSSFTINGNSQVLLTCDFNANHAFGTTIVRYTVVNDNDGNDTTNITIIYNIVPGPAGIPVNASGTNLEFFPNPAKDHVDFHFTNEMSGEKIIRVYAADGTLVREEKTSTDHLFMNTEEFAGGIYFCSVSMENKVLETGKIVITH